MTAQARIAHFPTSLRQRASLRRLGADVPALLIEPEAGQVARTGDGRAPVVVWLHGRGVSKELDSARYTRLMRGGLGLCALDLPGHGEREDPALQAREALPLLLGQTLAELDAVLDDLRRVPWVDPARLAIGGMSGGGMVALRRLGDPHPFRCAAVEATAGDFSRAVAPPASAAPAGTPTAGGPATSDRVERRFEAARLRGLDPLSRLAAWRPIPLLAMHSEADAVVPVAAIRGFVEALRARYAAEGAPRDLARLITWPHTGAPQEHQGFGKRAGEARQHLLAFFSEHLARA